MARHFSKKWLWALTVIPVAAGILLLVRGCDSENSSDNAQSAGRVEFVIDSLLNENRRLTDSLAVVNRRLGVCEGVRDSLNKKTDCPCKDKKPVVKKKQVVRKPKTEPVVVPKKEGTVAVPNIKVVVKDSSQNSGTVIVGNNNTVNNIIVNNQPQVVVVKDTVKSAQRVRRVLVGYASSQQTYTK